MTTFAEMLLALGSSIRTPSGLLRALAAAPRDARAVLADLAAAGLDAEAAAAVVAETPAALEVALPAVLPESEDGRDAWLDRVEVADRARRWLLGAAGSPAAGGDARGWMAPLLRHLEAVVAARTAVASAAEWAWQCAGRAAERLAVGPADLAPWASIPRALPDDLEPSGRVFDAWAVGAMHQDQASRLCGLVQSDGAWTSAYRGWLASQLDPLVVDRLPGPLAAVGPLPVGSVALPHLGEGAALAVEAEAREISFSWPGSTPVLVPRGAGPVEFPCDGVAGILRARVMEAEADVAEAAGVVLRALVMPKVDPLAEERLANSAARALAEAGSWAGLEATADAFDAGGEIGPDAEMLALLVLELRLALDRVAARLLSPALFDALEEADLRLDRCEAAMLAIPDDLWEGAVADEILDQGCWWGRRAAEEACLPRLPLAEALEGAAAPELAAGHEAARLAGRDDRGVHPSLLDRFLVLVGSPGQPWADALAHVRAAALAQMPAMAPVAWARAAGEEGVGRAPVAVVVEGEERALLFELRVTWGGCAGDPWEGAPHLRPGARHAFRQAFAAVARRTGTGLPPRTIDQHRVGLVPFDVGLPVDGPSLGLAAGLAMASLWTGVDLPEGLVASAAASWHGGDRLDAVGGIPEKLALLGAIAADAPVTLLVAAGQEGDLRRPGVDVARVDGWDDALRKAGLLDALRELEPDPLGLPLQERLDELARVTSHARGQVLAPYRGGEDEADAWVALADRLRLLIASLAGAPPWAEATVREARAWAALAFSYGRDLYASQEMLDPLQDAAMPEGAPSVLRDIVDLAIYISGDPKAAASPAERLADWRAKEASVSALAEATDRLEPASAIRLAGMSLGTRGRFWMHHPHCQLDLALPLLAAAVEHHAAHPEVRHEAPRSRVYVAMALRLQGRPAQALDQLALAHAELRAPEMAGLPYAETTAIFVRYEEARCLLEAGRVQDAVEAASNARDRMRRTGLQIPWGVHRTLAWACRVAGDAAGERAAIAAIAEIERLVPEPARARARRLLEEALGPVRSDGEVG